MRSPMPANLPFKLELVVSKILFRFVAERTLPSRSPALMLVSFCRLLDQPASRRPIKRLGVPLVFSAEGQMIQMERSSARILDVLRV